MSRILFFMIRGGVGVTVVGDRGGGGAGCSDLDDCMAAQCGEARRGAVPSGGD